MRYLVITEYGASGEGLYTYLGIVESENKESAKNIFMERSNIDSFFKCGLKCYNMDNEWDLCKITLQSIFTENTINLIKHTIDNNLIYKFHVNLS